MRITKTMTQKNLDSNRTNSRKTKGPKNTSRPSGNAVVHGVLSKKLRFSDEDERAEFDQLNTTLCTDLEPSGAVEHAQVFEISFAIWNLQKLNGWLMDELATARDRAGGILKTVAKEFGTEQFPISSAGSSGNIVREGWECQELVLGRAIARLPRTTALASTTRRRPCRLWSMPS
jgi:hypothetical protein